MTASPIGAKTPNQIGCNVYVAQKKGASTRRTPRHASYAGRPHVLCGRVVATIDVHRAVRFVAAVDASRADDAACVAAVIHDGRSYVIFGAEIYVD